VSCHGLGFSFITITFRLASMTAIGFVAHFHFAMSAPSWAPRIETTALDEFLRRFLLHLLPKGFVRIRHFGFLANRRRATLLPPCYRLFDAEQPSQSEPKASPAKRPNPRTSGAEAPTSCLPFDFRS